MNTIFALATAPGRAGLSVVRVSGPAAFEVARRLTGTVPPLRELALRSVHDAAGTPIDTGLVTAFDIGRSFTGERTVEFQVHGSPAVVAALLDALGALDGLRPALPGEFTRRALENDRLDLTQVEGLADLIDSETELQRRQALRVMSGQLGSVVTGWRERILRSVALLEAVIDFADEDVPVDVGPEVAALLQEILGEMRREIAGSRVAERIREGFEVAIVGAPNVGKSTLLNALAGREAAITSEVAGTTRDVIEVRMDLGGVPVTLLDTAGLRESEDRVERIGVERAKRRAEDADLRVFLLEPDGAPMLPPREGDILVCGKADLRGDADGVSGRTGQGLDALTGRIENALSERIGTPATAIRARQRHAIARALDLVEEGRHEAGRGEARVEYAAEALYRAARELDMLIGRVDVEHVLDEIFASFCIGK